jgi:hypothetical protein
MEDKHDDEPRSELICFRATASTKRAVERLARADDRRSVSAWVRTRIERAVEDEPDNAPR